MIQCHTVRVFANWWCFRIIGIRKCRVRIFAISRRLHHYLMYYTQVSTVSRIIRIAALTDTTVVGATIDIWLQSAVFLTGLTYRMYQEQVIYKSGLGRQCFITEAAVAVGIIIVFAFNFFLDLSLPTTVHLMHVSQEVSLIISVAEVRCFAGLAGTHEIHDS